MYRRDITDALCLMAKQYPVVTVTGPRQSGKTTLIKHVFSDKPYVNLESPDTRYFAINDPRGFLNQFPEGAIIDEVQRVPELLSYIQVIVDAHNRPGSFILTGSHQLSLHAAISQSLAGRTALLNLYPLTLAEMSEAGLHFSIDEQMYHGFYPRVFQQNLNPTQAYRDYYRTYVERDVRALINLKDVNLFDKFMRLCAGRIGSILELSSLSNEVGVSVHTISHWISLLEASYLIVRLPPYFNNMNKRVIKSPKLYFTDVGLACYLLNIETPMQLSRDPLRGFLFENMVVMDMLKSRYNANLSPNLYFYRDNHKNEVDLLLEKGRQFVAMEIKSAETFSKDFLKGLNFLKTAAPDKYLAGYVIYAGLESFDMHDTKIINYLNVNEIEA